MCYKQSYSNILISLGSTCNNIDMIFSVSCYINLQVNFSYLLVVHCHGGSICSSLLLRDLHYKTWRHMPKGWPLSESGFHLSKVLPKWLWLVSSSGWRDSIKAERSWHSGTLVFCYIHFMPNYREKEKRKPCFRVRVHLQLLKKSVLLQTLGD